jgi:hypothetical protein
MGCPEGNPGKCAYTCLLSYSIVVSHLSFNYLCLLLLYNMYLCGFAHSSTIAEPETELLGMPELFVELSSTINLTCSIRNTHRPPAKVVRVETKMFVFVFSRKFSSKFKRNQQKMLTFLQKHLFIRKFFLANLHKPNANAHRSLENLSVLFFHKSEFGSQKC